MKQIAKKNEGVGMKIRFTMDGGGKRLVCPFKRQEFWKWIGCVLSAVTYGKKGHNISSEVPNLSCRMAPTRLQRDLHGNKDLYKVCCDHYCHFYIFALH